MKENKINVSKLLKEEVASARIRTDERAKFEQKGGIWPTGDSGLLEGSMPFQQSFEHLLPKEIEDMKEYIERVLGKKKGKAIGLEIGGIGSQLFADFTPGFFAESAGVSLTDTRPFYGHTKVDDDTSRGHRVISGDMLNDDTKQQVDTWLQGRKTDLIVERMFGGLAYLPNEPFVLAQEADHWYKRLAEGGLFFAEIPNAFLDIMPAWVSAMNEEYPKALDIKAGKSKYIPYAAIIRKLPGSPEELPVLDAKTSLSIYKESAQKKWW